MNSWSLLQEQMDAEKKQKRYDAPWLDTTYDGFDEELMKKAVGFIDKYDNALKELAKSEREELKAELEAKKKE